MKTEHPITPPPELVEQWCHEEDDEIKTSPRWYRRVCAKAARWGADQELEACCKALEDIWDNDDVVTQGDFLQAFRAARRPKPPSLAEQGLNELDLISTHDQDGRSIDADISVIRSALERLKELEKGNG